MLNPHIETNRDKLLSLLVDEDNEIKANVRIYTMTALHLLLSGYPVHYKPEQEDGAKPHALAIDIAELIGLKVSKTGSKAKGTLRHGLKQKVDDPDTMLRELVELLSVKVDNLDKAILRWGRLSRDREKFKRPLFANHA